MSASNYLENKIRDHLNGVAAYTAPATVYFSLHTSNPGETGATAEVSGGSYARAAHDNDGTGWDAASGGSAANAAVIQFPDASGANWGTVTHYGKWDASSGGNCLEYGALAASKVINDGDPGPRWNVGDLVESVD
jgi:hypothetical protein